MIALFAAAHLFLFSWPDQPAKVLFELPSEGESACGIATVQFGAPDGSWSSGSGGQKATCEFRQYVEPGSLLSQWVAAGKAKAGADVEVAWTLQGGRATGIKARREDGVVRPLLPLWREETEAYCVAVGLRFRSDSSNRELKLPQRFESPFGGGAMQQGLAAGRSIRDVERQLIELTLDHFAGDKKAAAETLGISLNTLYNRLNAYRDPETP